MIECCVVAVNIETRRKYYQMFINQIEKVCFDIFSNYLNFTDTPSFRPKNGKSPVLLDTDEEVFVEEKSDESDANGNNNYKPHKQVDDSSLDPKNHTTFENGDKETSQNVVIPPANENGENCCRKCNSNLIFF